MLCDVLMCEHNEDGVCYGKPYIDEGGMCVSMRLLPEDEWPEEDNEH